MQGSFGDAIILSYNRKAMSSLRDEDFESSQKYLSKAEEFLKSSRLKNAHKLYCLTLNNFGCFHKRTGNIPLALTYLTKALTLETRPPININTLSGTHLNLCAIYSLTKDHNKALAHSLKALNLLKSKYIEDPSVLTTLLAAHYNAGLEYEHLNKHSEAYNLFTKGWQISTENLGEGHPLTISLKRCISPAQRPVSLSPLRNSPMSKYVKPQSSIGSTPRTISARKIDKVYKSDLDRFRFVTGERLRPMFKKEDKVKSAKKVYCLIEDLHQGSAKESNSVDMSESSSNLCRSFIEDDKENTVSTDFYETSKEKKVNISTQADIYDRNVYKAIRGNAAIVIQKNIRGYLARKKYQIQKCSKLLKDAEKQVRKAKERLKGLTRAKVLLKPAIAKEIDDSIPVAYKDKVFTPTKRRAQRQISPLSKNSPTLETIPEESHPAQYKVVNIQRNFRGWIVRKEYILKRNAVIKIQTNIRRYQCRKLYLQIRNAVIFIQRQWRFYSAAFLNHRKNSSIIRNKLTIISYL